MPSWLQDLMTQSWMTADMNGHLTRCGGCGELQQMLGSTIIIPQIGDSDSIPTTRDHYTLDVSGTKDSLKNSAFSLSGQLPACCVWEYEDEQNLDVVADIRTLFCGDTSNTPATFDNFAVEQHRDPEVLEIMEYAEKGKVPEDAHRARQLVLEGSVFIIADGVAYYVYPK